MVKIHKKEFLLVEENPESVEVFFSLSKKYKLENKLIHAWSIEEASNILLFENVSSLKLIVIKINNSSVSQIALVSKIRSNDTLKSIPIAIITNSWGSEEIIKTENIIINALIFNPIDLIKFKRIISLAGYHCNDESAK